MPRHLLPVRGVFKLFPINKLLGETLIVQFELFDDILPLPDLGREYLQQYHPAVYPQSVSLLWYSISALLPELPEIDLLLHK